MSPSRKIRFIGLVPLLIFVSAPGLIAAGCAKQPVIKTAAAPTTPEAPRTTMPPGIGTPQPTGTPEEGAALQGARTPQGTGTVQEGPAAVKPGPPLALAPESPAPAITPGTQRPAPKEFTLISALRDIHFDFDKYDIRPGDAKILDEHSAWLRANRESLVLIEGHADERGTNEYNLALGERRAKATMNYLVARGVPPGQLLLIPYGEDRPLCIKKNEACWSRNRRAHFLVKRR